VANEAETSVYSSEDIQRGGHTILEALHNTSPLTEQELIARLGQPRGLVLIVCMVLQRDGRITVDGQVGGRTYRLTP
jgi:DNA-binding IclR family transcriptional regulator